MRSSAIISLAVTTLAGLSFVTAAGGPHHRVGGRGHRAIVAERQAKSEAAIIEGVYKREGNTVSRKYKKRGGKTCKVRGTGSKPTSTLSAASSIASSAVVSSTAVTSSSSSSEAAPSSSGPAIAAAILQPVSSVVSSAAASATGAWDQWTSSSSSSYQASPTSVWTSAAAPTTSTTAHPAPTGAPPANTGLLQASGPCGDCQASADHPNGAAWWLNCGLNAAGGWAPPSVAAHQLISITDPNSYPAIFGSCLQYNDIFADAAAKQNMPTALLMAIGMQESGCKRDAQGSRGEQGIMQVAGNACDNPSGDCKEPWYNIHKGAQILVDKMGGDPNGNIISALGQYNGWMPGMQAGDGAQFGPQGQKVSYLDDMLNKWLQGKSSY